MAAKLTEEVKVTAMPAKEQLEAMVREAMLRGVQEGLGGALASAEARLRAVTDEAATKLKEVAQGVSEMTTKFTDSTTRYHDALASPPLEAVGRSLGLHSWGQG